MMSGKRYRVLDEIRGAAVLSMVLYHAAWDLVHLQGAAWQWFRQWQGYVWQQSICLTFILLSGFCWALGLHPFRRGLTVWLSGALVTVVTFFVMPESYIRFGVLTLLGTCTILMVPAERLLRRCPPLAGLALSMAAFVLLRDVNRGWLGFEGYELLRLPQGWYRNLLTAGLGFPPEGFYSEDYFPLFPWIFLFLFGYFLYRLLEQRQLLSCLERGRVGALEWVGRHALPIYLLHQPILFALWSLI